MNTSIAGNLSQRGWANVGTIMPKIKGALKERVKQDNPNIDMASAENFLIRDEVIEICKRGIEKELLPKVRLTRDMQEIKQPVC